MTREDGETFATRWAYTSESDDNTKRVSENVTFDESGQVVAAEVFHGVSGPAD